MIFAEMIQIHAVLIKNDLNQGEWSSRRDRRKALANAQCSYAVDLATRVIAAASASDIPPK
jgi:hypothetical protein